MNHHLTAEAIERQIRDEFFEGQWIKQYSADNIQYVAFELLGRGFKKQEVIDLIATVIDVTDAESEE